MPPEPDVRVSAGVVTVDVPGVPTYVVVDENPYVRTFWNPGDPRSPDRAAHQAGIAKTPGFAFKDRTGDLRRSIRRVSRFNVNMGGPSASYAAYIEFGTRTMAPRRPMTRAARQAARDIR